MQAAAVCLSAIRRRCDHIWNHWKQVWIGLKSGVRLKEKAKLTNKTDKRERESVLYNTSRCRRRSVSSLWRKKRPDGHLCTKKWAKNSTQTHTETRTHRDTQTHTHTHTHTHTVLQQCVLYWIHLESLIKKTPILLPKQAFPRQILNKELLKITTIEPSQTILTVSTTNH